MELFGNCLGTRSTYHASAVALEDAVIDLDITTRSSINSSALEFACPPPGIEAEKSRKFFRAEK
jgi:hypothetical protein